MKRQSKNKKKPYKDRDLQSNKDTVISPIPKEIDSHFKLFGKHMWDIKFFEKCEICNSPFDEFGFCACGSGKS